MHSVIGRILVKIGQQGKPDVRIKSRGQELFLRILLDPKSIRRRIRDGFRGPRVADTNVGRLA